MIVLFYKLNYHNLNFGKIIVARNKRNTIWQIEAKLLFVEILKINKQDKKLFKTRVKVEHFFSQYRIILIRYDKETKTYLNYVLYIK